MHLQAPHHLAPIASRLQVSKRCLVITQSDVHHGEGRSGNPACLGGCLELVQQAPGFPHESGARQRGSQSRQYRWNVSAQRASASQTARWTPRNGPGARKREPWRCRLDRTSDRAGAAGRILPARPRSRAASSSHSRSHRRGWVRADRDDAPCRFQKAPRRSGPVKPGSRLRTNAARANSRD